MEWTAKWIWKRRRAYTAYNDVIEARRTFRLPRFERATLAVTADTWYRLYVNGEWVNDGPCRSWPQHFQYDVLDLTPWLRRGDNEVRVVAGYHGCGSFHHVPAQAGLLAQLDVALADGKRRVLGTDRRWEVRDYRLLVQSTPKTCIQMGPLEQADARQAGKGTFAPAEELFGPTEGPWSGLLPRDVALLTREPRHFASFLGATVVDPEWTAWTFPIARLLYPGLVEANIIQNLACALATTIVADSRARLRVDAPLLRVLVNGKAAKNNVFQIEPGESLLIAAVPAPYDHWSKDVMLRLVEAESLRLKNPLAPGTESPWCIVPVGPRFAEADMAYALRDEQDREAILQAAQEELDSLLAHAADARAFLAHAGARAKVIPGSMLMDAVHEQVEARRVLGDAGERVDAPEALMHDSPAVTEVAPGPDGDVELLYDLGKQAVGYYELELEAAEGCLVDIAGIEYLDPTGSPQYTSPYRNSIRYVCAEGVNRFVSFRRRSQRYVYVTLRNQRGPVRIRLLRLIESTYPVQRQGGFDCSDSLLTRIWDVSARTLKLCMEDTFTDCPLYEQTLWVGDARNESLFAFTAYGAEDLSARCIRLAGESLDRLPMVGCQVPSSWDTLLPAWSFLWGLHVWDHYWHTGDAAFLREMFPLVLANLEGADSFQDERGLFSAPFWNMFDWAPIDDNHSTVLHLSMFQVAAIDAALRCAQALGEKAPRKALQDRRDQLRAAINALWDPKTGSYPDSINDNGTVSPSRSQHTSFLALLYGIAEPEMQEACLRNVLDPPEGMVRVGSPFAIHYLYEALDKLGHGDRILEMVRENYAPMLKLGATTVWENFHNGNDNAPTRSHCHAWSSAPIYFLNRLALGITQQAPGGARFTVSPRITGLDWASGANATVRGPLRVRWERDGDTLRIDTDAPAGTNTAFARNDTHEGLKVVFNGRTQK